MALYTSAELVQKLKDLDEKLESAVSRSDLDTGQSKSSLAFSITTLQKQYEKYSSMLQEVDPETYRAIFGSSVIRFRSYECQR